MAQLEELASVIRSKNAGPFQITIDLMFETDEIYDKVRNAGVLTAERIAPLYGVTPQQVHIVAFDRVRAIKVTVPRRSGVRGSGSAFDRDVYGAQQHGPLTGLVIP